MAVRASELLAGLFLVQVGADGERGIRIDGAFVKINVLDDAILVDDDVCALRPLIIFALDVVTFEDSVVLEHFLIHIAEEREFDVDLLGECGVCCRGIHTDAENHRIRGINLTGSESSLDRLKLLRSTTGESEDVDSEENIFLAAKFRELDGLPLIAEKSKVGGVIADFECGLGDLFRILRTRRIDERNRQAGKKQERCNCTSGLQEASFLASRRTLA